MPSMPVDAAFLKGLIESELATVSDPRVIDHIRGMLVEPHVLLRSWSYGDQRYPCWMVLDDSADSGGEIAYCEYGFGPRCPWGLVSSGSSVEDQQMGMDFSWYPTFLGAFFEFFCLRRASDLACFQDKFRRLSYSDLRSGELGRHLETRNAPARKRSDSTVRLQSRNLLRCLGRARG